MNISYEDKLRICARAFFDDNRDEYEDFHEAKIDFMGENKPNEKFVEFCVEPYLKVPEGCLLFIRDDGHMILYRESDGFVEPLFEMTDEEGQAEEEKNEQLYHQFPNIEPQEMLEKMGWRRVIP